MFVAQCVIKSSEAAIYRAIAHLSEKRIRGRHGRPTCNSIFFSDRFVRTENDDGTQQKALEYLRLARVKARAAGHSAPVVGFSGAVGVKPGLLRKQPERRISRKTPEDGVCWKYVVDQYSKSIGDSVKRPAQNAQAPKGKIRRIS